MKKIDLMIFDFDGTLVDTGTDLVQSINYALRALKLPERTEKEIISFVGDGVGKLMERALGKDHVGLQEEAMQIFSRYYGEHLLDNSVLYPGVKEVLDNFRHKTKIILTNKGYRYTLSIVEGLQIEHYFAEIIGADSTPFLKPDRRVMDYVFRKHQSAGENVLIVGDGINDVMIARNSGILSCALLNGLGNRADLLKLNPDYYCEDILELNSLFM
ncbi:MAG: HAD-IA family hydrolase [Smithella sp.]